MGTIGVIDINPTRVLSCSRPFRVHGRTSLRGDLGEEEEEEERGGGMVGGSEKRRELCVGEGGVGQRKEICKYNCVGGLIKSE